MMEIVISGELRDWTEWTPKSDNISYLFKTKPAHKMDWLTAKVNGNDRADNLRNLKEVETTLDLR